MEHDGERVRGWPIDLEATVADNVRRLREGRGLTQQQLGSDLSHHGVGMHQTTVAKLEAGSKPLRLNEVAAIAAYFEVVIESLWEPTAVILNEHELALLTSEVEAAETAFGETHTEIRETKEGLNEATEQSDIAMARYVKALRRQKGLKAQLADLQQRRDAAQTALGNEPTN